MSEKNPSAEGTPAHDRLVHAIVARQDAGWGITTAEPYARSFLDCGDQQCERYFHNAKNYDAAALLKDAASRLTFHVDGMEVDTRMTRRRFHRLLPDIVEHNALESTLQGSDFLDRFEKDQRPDKAADGGPQFPEHTLLGFRNVVTTNEEDRDGDVLETSGAIVDVAMPLLWQHIHQIPIGKMVTVVEHSDTTLRVVSALLDLNDLTEDAAKLIEAGALRISHGFKALEFEDRKGPNGEAPRQGQHFGFRITSFEIMEQSLVSVPSNRGAAIEAFSRQKLASDLMRSYAKNLQDQEPLTVPVNIDLTVKTTVENGKKMPEPDSTAHDSAPHKGCGCPKGTDCMCEAANNLSVEVAEALLKDLDRQVLGDEDGKAGQTPIAAETPEPSPLVQAEHGQQEPPKLVDCIEFVLMANAEERQALRDNLDAMDRIDAVNRQAEAYRQLVGA